MTAELTIYDYIDIKTLSNITGILVSTLQKRCQRNKYQCRWISSKGGKNGQKPEILIASLPMDLRNKVILTYQKKDTANSSCGNGLVGDSQKLDLPSGGDSFHFPKTAAFSAPDFSSDLISQNITTTTAAVPQGMSCYSQLPLPQGSGSNFLKVPDSAKQIALAKYNVVNFWKDFRKEHKDKKEADGLFLIAYQTLKNFASVKKVLGEISLGSIYRWAKTLKDNNNDYYSLINNYKYGSFFKNNTTLTDEEKQEFVLLYYNSSQFDLGTAYKLIKYNHNLAGKETKSESTYRRFANFIKRNHYDFEVLARKGEKALKDEVVPSIRRDTSMLKVGDILVADGNKLDFMIINPFTGKPARAIMVVFMDWCSRDFLGYDIMFSENTQCIASALRNAILRLGKMPKVVYMDNGRAFRSKFFTGYDSFDTSSFKGVYEHLGIKTTFAKPYNGRAKIVERSFGNFVKSCPPVVSSYIGSSIEKRPAQYKRNEKFQKELHKNDKIPTIAQAKQIINAWLDFYRAQNHPEMKDKTIGEVFEQGRGQGINEELLNELMMCELERTADRSTIKLFNLDYSCPALYGISGKIKIKYSLSNLESILVYTLKGEYIGKAELVQTYNAMASYFGNVIDMQSVKQAQKKQNSLIKGSMKKTKLLIGNSSQSFENIPWAQVSTQQTEIKLIENKQVKPKKRYDILAGFGKQI